MDTSYYIGSEIEIRPSVPAETLAGTRYLPEGMDDTDSEVFVILDDGDGSTVVPARANRETTRPDSIVDDVRRLVDLLGPGYTYHGELRIDDPEGGPPSRVRVVRDDARWVAVQEQAEVVYPADYAIPPGPAVVFDADAARAWLADRSAAGASRGQTDYNLDTAADAVYDPTDNSPADWLERTLHDLADDPPIAPHVWRTAPGVAVEVVETIGPEPHADGGAVLVVDVGGQRIASHRLAWNDLARASYDEHGNPSRPQLDAAVEALAAAADTVNNLIEHQRAVRAADIATHTTLCTVPSLAAQLSLADVECALRTLVGLWDGDDPGDVLTDRQREAADRLAALVAAEDAADEVDAATGEHPHDSGAHTDVQ